MVTHKTLVKIHGFIAVFFLPFSILYATTGVLYIAGEGGAAAPTRFRISTNGGWPTTIEAARDIVDAALGEKGLPRTKGSAGQRKVSETVYNWRALTHSVTMTRAADSEAEIVLQDYGLYRQLVEIHKNHAGIAFSVIGFAFGLAMIALVTSGTLMIFRSRIHRKGATIVVACGTVLSLIAYFISSST